MTGIHKRFGATVALDDVGLTVRDGEVYALVGENGAGKSTLVKILSGAYQPDQGQMLLGDVPYSPSDPQDGRRAGVAMIYQELALAQHLSVAENIFLGTEPGRGLLLDWDSMLTRSKRAMEEVGLDGISPDEKVSHLSVGQQQLVEIARAIATGFRLLVLDEPTSSLSEEDRLRLFSLIRRLRDQGHAIIYISHFLEEVQEIGDRYTVLRDGRSVGSGETADTSPNEIAAMMVGREVGELYPRTNRQTGEAVLEVTNLSGAGGLKSASLELRRGEVLGVAGLVGAGRTELLRAIFGLDSVQSGRVRVGAFLGSASPTQRWAQNVGLVSEDRKGEGLALTLSVSDNLTLTRLENMGPAGLVFSKRQNEAAARWIQRLGIKCRGPSQTLSELSGGNQQKIALARLLHHDADVLLLDEPTRGIDVASKADIYKLINGLASGDPELGNQPKAILMVSSYLPELLGVCDRIAVMCRGVLHPARPAAELSEHEIMKEATGSWDSK